MSNNPDGYFVCPHCGAELPNEAGFCPKCGSDNKTGWSENAEDTGMELPGDYTESDYNKFIQQEFGKGRTSKLTYWFTAILLIVIVFLLVFYYYL